MHGLPRDGDCHGLRIDEWRTNKRLLSILNVAKAFALLACFAFYEAPFRTTLGAEEIRLIRACQL